MNGISKMYIGSLEVPSNVWMAPMVDYTAFPFRRLVQRLGAGVAFSEMVNVDMLTQGDRTMERRLKMHPQEPVKAVQLMGTEPALMERLCCSERLQDADMIDINMACPNLAVVKNGGGCGLLEDLTRAARIIESCKRSGKTVSVKCRPGIRREKIVIESFARMCEQAGADVITVHGRTLDMDYSCPSEASYIARAKAAVSIPVIANGDISSEKDAEALLKKTQADGIMIGRQALKDPFLFTRITGKTQDKKNLYMEQVTILTQTDPEYRDDRYLQNLLISFLPGEKKQKEILAQIRNAWCTQQFLDLADRLL